MRLTDAEKGPFHHMREVSELRIQYQCEYRLYLHQKFEDDHTPASITGTDLHRRVAIRSENQSREKNDDRLVPLLIIIMTLIAGMFWILW